MAKNANRAVCRVLCVVPATTPRLNTDTAFGMVVEAERQQDTILVLTMADKVLAGDAATFEDDILKRVLCKAGELISHGLHVLRMRLASLKTQLSKAAGTHFLSGSSCNRCCILLPFTQCRALG